MKAQKILIVDDDIDVINVLTTILENEGYEVLSAFDKKEGLKLAHNEKPDMAILDVMMTTHYEGFELAKELSEDEALKKIPVLMQTSIDVLETTKESVREMAREFRSDARYRELQVILLRDVISGKAGVDYRAKDGRSIWLPVSGFLRKPVDAKKLLSEIKLHMGRQIAKS
ncbi:MAG: response regulator [Bacteroidales bacterium]|nr:response regulator [Lentimicrobiaceae bacterium]MDD5694495.1 response regulator [Bacteroidales bacterium]